MATAEPVSNEAYHADHSVISKTMLALCMDSPEEYKSTYIDGTMAPREPSKPMLIGTILHAMLLEGKGFYGVLGTYPDDCLRSDGGLNGKRAAAWREDNPGMVVYVKQSEADQICEAVETVLQQSKIGEVIQQATTREHIYTATLEGLPCKCKPDVACDLETKVVAYDLKFVERLTRDSFRRTGKRLRYWLQDAHYSAVLAEHFGKPVQFRFCSIEVRPPYRVRWNWYDELSRETARAEHKRQLRELKRRIDENDWNDDWEPSVTLSPWDFADADELVTVE